MLLRKTRTLAGWVLTVLAAVFVYMALVVPDTIGRPKDGTYVEAAFVRLPMELIVGGAVLLALAPRWRRWAAMLFGLGLGAVLILKVANIGFRIVLGRAFNPVLDYPLFRDGYNALAESDGRTEAIAAAVGAVVAAVLALVLCTLAVLRLSKLTARYPGPARRTLVALSAAWIALAITGLTWFPGAPAASDTAAALLKSTVTQVPAAIRDQHQFAYASEHDPYHTIAPKDLVSGLTGKDVVIGVVESYGRSALTDPGMKAIVEPVLKTDEQKLTAAGFAARTGWLTSSTYGGGSWFAHASLQSGLWITNQQRYTQLTGSDRVTLTSTFHQAGWHTVGMEPGNTVAWPEASFYGYDQVYDSRNMGYKGPKFGWSSMPDQYTLATFQKDVYAKKTGPLMAELTLTSSHEPWTPIPKTVDWNAVGDGSIYRPMVKGAESRSSLWSSPARTQTQYAKTIAYSVDNLISWAQKYGDKNLVLIMFGDHQPMSVVSGNGASHDIPITVIARDKSVLDRIADWNWADGLQPTASTPVWRMDQFRDKFFQAYGKQNSVALPAPR